MKYFTVLPIFFFCRMAATQHWTSYPGDLAVMTPGFIPEFLYDFWEDSGFGFL